MSDLGRILTEIPGPKSREMAIDLRRFESHNVTYVGRDQPIFWESAHGALVIDVDGNEFLDFTSAFGVAAVGHGNEAVAAAIAAQARILAHGMGDVHPTGIRARLLSRLAAISPIEPCKIFLCSTGSESVEFALKTAAIATGDPGVLSFGGAYHGLSYGALSICGIPKFRKPFERQLNEDVLFAAYPAVGSGVPLGTTLKEIGKTLKRNRGIGAIVVEPVQGRAGYLAAPEGFLSGLRELCTQNDVLLIVDEIYTGFGRTGTMFACEQEGVRPDVLCVGKALGGGFPIAAAIVRSEIADAWPESQGEALHTSTFLGNPMACAAALAVLDEFNAKGLVPRAQRMGEYFAERLPKLVRAGIRTRGRGAMWALEFGDGAAATAVVAAALRRGLIVLQAGMAGNVVTMSPPLVTSEQQLERGLSILGAAIGEVITGSAGHPAT